MLVVLLRKQIMTQKLVNSKRKLLIIIITNILLLQSLTIQLLELFNARLAQANLITKTNFDAKISSFNRKIRSNKTKQLLLENELNKLKTFDSSYLLTKFILKKMVHKIIQYFSQCMDTFTEFVVLLVIIIFILRNLKDCQMKILQLLLQVITNSIQN